MPATTRPTSTGDSRPSGARPVPGADEDDITRLRFVLLRLGRRLRHEGPEGITPTQLSALSVVGSAGSITIGDLAAIEAVQPPTMSRIVAALELDGWVERVADRSDRRVSLVRTTVKGEEELERVRAERNAFLASRLARLTPDERAAVLAALPSLEHMLQEGE
ncbi:MAG TPA: MarR family transcriptional regulator [Acidimicrobiales bacterium]